MNFLELVQATWRESGSGGSAPTNVEGQQGEADRLVNWVRDADLWVQTQHIDWQFLWGQESINTVIGQTLYNPVASVQEYDRETFFYGSNCLEVANYLDVRSEALPENAGAPWRAVIMPSKSLRIDPEPDAEYEIRFDYWVEPVPLGINTSESMVPVAMQRAIIGKALMYYGEYENAPEILQKGAMMLQEWMVRMENRYLPGDRDYHGIAEGNDWVMSVE